MQNIRTADLCGLQRPGDGRERVDPTQREPIRVPKTKIPKRDTTFSSLNSNNGAPPPSLSAAGVPPEVNLSARRRRRKGGETKKGKTGRSGHPAAPAGLYY